MKVSINLIRYYRNLYNWSADPAPGGIEALADRIGGQLGAIEEIVEYGKRYDGVLVVRVVACEQHPDADRLHVCSVDDGGQAKDVARDTNGYVQVVCGAPNVHEGMLAAWLPPGTTVPSTFDKEPFVMEAREIRGQVSNGMMASPKELGIGDSHEGILEVDVDVKPGTLFATAYDLTDEYILDVENKMFTHRPDCFGIMGVAREIAGIQGQAFKSPEWYQVNPGLPPAGHESLEFEVRNELPELVPRFTAVTMSGISVKPSPIWLQSYLVRLGVRPINNIVDLTNYHMLLTGQPLHAYDYDKVKAHSNGAAILVVRNPKPGEKIALLNGKTIEPRTEAIMIATDKQLIGVGGVMGGAETEVDEHTKNIILECGNFDMYSIRRTSMAHGLFTDAVTRFNKGQSPLQNLAVLRLAANDVNEHAGGHLAGDVLDDNHLSSEMLSRASVHPPVVVAVEFINTRLGLTLSAAEMKQLLENVEFTVTDDHDTLTVCAPFWRTDIELREDVVEEIGRLYGYDALPLELPKRDITPAARDPLLELKARIRQTLSKAGANEVLTYSFVHGNLLSKVGQDPNQAFQLGNALSPDLQYYRLSLTPSLLDKVHSNIKAGYDEFALFEIGKSHDKSAVGEDGLPLEFDQLALVYAASGQGKSGAAYYEARTFLMALAGAVGVELDFVPLAKPGWATDTPFAPGRSAIVRLKGSDQGFGVLGEYDAAVRRQLKLPAKSAGFEIGIGALLGQKPVNRYVPLPRFPKVEQDICLKVSADMTYQQLFDCVSKHIEQEKPAHSLATLTPLDIYQRDDDTGHKQLTFRLAIANYDRTLTDKEVNSLLDGAAAAAKQAFGAERI